MRYLVAALLVWGLCTGVGSVPVQSGEQTGGGDEARETTTTRPAVDAEATDTKRPERPPLTGPPHRNGRRGHPGQRDPGHPFRLPPGSHGPHGLDVEPLDSEEVERLMKKAEKNFPQLHNRLSRLRRVDPPRFMRMLHRARGPLLGDWGQQEIQAHQMQVELQGLARRYQGATSESDREAITMRMKGMITQHVEKRLNAVREDIRRAERRLEEARHDLAEKEAHKDQFIDQRIESLIRRGKGSLRGYRKWPTQRSDQEGRRPDRERNRAKEPGI